MKEERVLQRAARKRLGQLPVTGLAGSLRALSDETRLRILVLLAGGERCVCDIVELLEMPQNLVSHHLSVLRRVGLVKDRRDEADARWVYYSISPRAVARLQAELGKVLDLGQQSPVPAYCPPRGRHARG